MTDERVSENRSFLDDINESSPPAKAEPTTKQLKNYLSVGQGWLVKMYDKMMGEAELSDDYVDRFLDRMESWVGWESQLRKRNSFAGACVLGAALCNPESPVICDFCASMKGARACGRGATVTTDARQPALDGLKPSSQMH